MYIATSSNEYFNFAKGSFFGTGSSIVTGQLLLSVSAPLAVNFIMHRNQQFFCLVTGTLHKNEMVFYFEVNPYSSSL